MAELRRLLIESGRLKADVDVDRFLTLTSKETHYLKRVLRLRKGDLIAIVDGIGHIWNATVQDGNSIELCSSLDCPLDEQPRQNPLIGLAVALPKKGFDELLRMSCEMGVDIIQPLSSERGVVRIEGEGRSLRWKGILREAVEQSERLWCPDLLSICDVQDWLKDRPSKYACAFASPRLSRSIDLQVWMMGPMKDIDQIWVAIGPEGGWTPEEQFLAKELGCIEVQIGESILRTVTAAVAATQLMVAWRKNGSIYFQ